MQIAIASGKGGTGKTTIAVNLAHLAGTHRMDVSYLDCDVEEPNGHIFLKPAIQSRLRVTTPVPEVDQNSCTHCGMCEDICQYNAIVCLNDNVLVFPELCHSCGGCFLLCPQKAISEVPREVGRLEIGMAGGVGFAGGTLAIGETKSPPVIKAVKAALQESALRIIDAPPGTSCPVIESIRDSDYVILATEPTPFGLNDLELAVEVIRKTGIPFGVVINRAGNGYRDVNTYCDRQGIEILAEIPEDRKAAEIYSRGELLCERLDGFEKIFAELLERVVVRTSETYVSPEHDNLPLSGNIRIRR